MTGAALLFWALSAGAASATDYSQTVAGATAYITNRMSLDHIPGMAVALVDSQEVAWAAGFGFADLEAGVPVRTDTVYRVGSVSKMFATIALMQLVEEGRFALDTPLVDVLPSFHLWPRDFGLPATNTLVARHMVNYHSGLPGDLFNAGATFLPFDGYEEWLFGYLPATPPLYPPDLVNNYCNVGFTLAERAVRLHNTNAWSYAEYCRRKIFDPLGMSSTSLLKDRAAISNNLARVYVFAEGQQIPLPEQHLNMRGAGGAYSTADDMARFARMLLADGLGPSGRVLEASSIAAMGERQGGGLPLNVDNRWVPGLGWDAVTNPRLSHAGGRVFLKGGAVENGHCAFVEVMPAAQLAAVAVSDAEVNAAWDVCDTMLRLALRDKFGLPGPDPVAPAASTLITNRPPAELEPLAGAYVKIAGFDLFLTNGHSLTWIEGAENPGATPVELWPRENGWFSPTDSQAIELCFTNLSGRDVVVARYLWPDASFIWQLLYAERSPPAELSAAWSNRLDQVWPVTDACADDYGFLGVEALGLAAGLKLSLAHGLLTVTDLSGQVQVIEPVDDDTAFVRGITPRCDSAVRYMQTNGMKVLQFGGFRYRDPADVPDIGADETVSSNLIAEGLGALYAFAPPRTGLLYEAVCSAPDSFRLWRLDHDGLYRGAAAPGTALAFESAQTQACYLYVLAGLAGPRTGAYELALSYPLRLRGLEREPAGWVLRWQGKTNATYSLLGGADLAGGFTPVLTGLSGDYIQRATGTVAGAARFFAVEKE